MYLGLPRLTRIIGETASRGSSSGLYPDDERYSQLWTPAGGYCVQELAIGQCPRTKSGCHGSQFRLVDELEQQVTGCDGAPFGQSGQTSQTDEAVATQLSTSFSRVTRSFISLTMLHI